MTSIPHAATIGRRILAAALAAFVTITKSPAQTADDATVFIKARGVIALTHVRVVDGRGHAPAEDQTVVLRNGRIAAIGPAAATEAPEGATTIDGSGKTVVPGFVMMHEHLYFTSRASTTAPFHINEMDYSFPRLYLACGLTTVRTGGCVEPYTDLEIKARVDQGLSPGPKLHLTAPYVEGAPSIIAQLHPVDDAADAAKLVNFWADKGFTSVKLYMHLTRDEAKAAIDAAHARHLKVTGHIGLMTYREAAELGIDNLEHGFYAATDFVRGKRDGDLPNPAAVQASIDALDVNGAEATALIQTLIDRHVAITSTLPVFEASVPGRPMVSARELELFSALARENYLKTWARVNAPNDGRTLATWKKMLALEKRFYDAGGTLLAGTDPTGYGAVIAGFGSLRELELLVEAGLTPVQAIQVASYNGAKFLGEDTEIGSVEVGKVADLVLVGGNPAQTIADLRKVEIVFKDGVGFDSAKLIDSAKGFVGVQ